MEQHRLPLTAGAMATSQHALASAGPTDSASLLGLPVELQAMAIEYVRYPPVTQRSMLATNMATDHV